MHRTPELGNLVRVRTFGAVLEVGLLQVGGQPTREREEQREAPMRSSTTREKIIPARMTGSMAYRPGWVGAKRPFSVGQK